MKPKRVTKNKEGSCRPTPNHWHKMNHKQRREVMRKIQSEDLGLEVVHPDAAGIDIGNESHHVAVPPTRDSQTVRRFGCTTAELKAMADWLKQCKIRTMPCNRLGCIGSRFTTFSKKLVSKCIWSIPGRRRTYQDANVMCRRVNG